MDQADRIDSMSIPTPGELLCALDKCATVDWPARYRPPTATSFRNRSQMALNLGALVADGYLAVQAQDAQQVKNIGRDVVALAKPLGVQQDILNRGKSLADFASAGKWDTLREELEATQNEAKMALLENKDPDLVVLVTVGGWLRGAEALTNYLGDHYSPKAARLIRQPGVARLLNVQLDGLQEKTRHDAILKKVRAFCSELAPQFSFPDEAPPTREKVQEIGRKLSELLLEISRREVK